MLRCGMENFLQTQIRYLDDPRIWILLFMFAGWARRIQRALRTFVLAPIVKPMAYNAAEEAPRVSVLIPVKNEENNIRDCLECFLNQNYPHYEIIVANDSSTDKTGEILNDYQGRVQILSIPKTPEGWTGKNFALHTAAKTATGDWLLFTDADTRHNPQAIASALRHATHRRLDFLTLLPRCLAKGFLENLIQPTAMGLMGLWFPIEKINTPSSKINFANGQFLLLKKNLYRKIGGHQEVKGAFLEDFELIAKARKEKAKVECAFGTRIYGTRMYDSLDAMWRGWRRIYLHAFKQNPLRLLSKAFGTLFHSVIPFALFLTLSATQWTAPAVYEMPWRMTFFLMLIVWITAWKTYDMVKAKKTYAFLHPIAAFFVTLFLLDAFWMALLKKKTVWR